jgi:hypothetical protein
MVHFQFACRHDATVAGDDPTILVDQHRIGESKLFDRCRDLGHLRVAVRTAVAYVRNELINLNGFNLVRKFHSVALHQNPPLRVVVQVTLPSQFLTHLVVVCAWAKVAAKVMAMMMMAFMLLLSWL